MKIVAICNHKGGSAKTTSTYYLGQLLAEAELRTLLVDLDPQANLSARFDYGCEYTVADALGGAIEPRVMMADTIASVYRNGRTVAGLHLCPSEMPLANTAVGLLNDAVRGRTALRRALASVKADYDICLIDCPPEAGIMLVNALLAADGVICPAEPETDALAGIKRVAEIVDHIRREFERETPVMLGTIATHVDLRTNRHRDGLDVMKSSALVPLRGIVRESNGEQRDDNLRMSYAQVSIFLRDWVKEGAC
jgi:chromosome partitioning protein